MKVSFRPDGGRFGYGFDYFCWECGVYVGNSNDDEFLLHPATEETGGIFRKKIVTTLTCSNAGKKCAIPRHIFEATEIP
jgi:hypothetical protein